MKAKVHWQDADFFFPTLGILSVTALAEGCPGTSVSLAEMSVHAERHHGTQILVSGPSAWMGWKELRIRAASAAHR